MPDNFWSFKNNSAWKKKWETCKGSSKNQSPIDIKRNKVESCSTLCQLKLDYKPSKCNVIVQNEVITIRYDSGSYAYFNDDVFELMEAKIHVPSMHMLDGDHYDMEIDLYHCKSVDTMVSSSGGINTSCPDGGLIVGIFVQSGVEFGQSAEWFNQFLNKVPIPETLNNDPIEKSIPVSPRWNIKDILPKNKSFYTYKGSRPYPPCDENWTWVVFQDYVTIGSTNYETLKFNLSDNIRGIRPLKGRIVYHYNEPKLEPVTEEDKKENGGETSTTLQLLESRQRQAWFERNREYIKQLLFSIIVVVLILLALRTTVIVLQQGYFQKWVENQLAHKAKMNSGNNMAGGNNGMGNNGMVNNGANMAGANNMGNAGTVNNGAVNNDAPQ